MVQIPGVYVEIKGDLTQLNKDMRQARQVVTEQAKGMSDSLNNALSGSQIKNSTNKLIDSLGTLSRSSVVTGNAFKSLGVDLGQLQKLTGTSADQFKKLQEQILKTQTASGQERALRNIATAAGLSTREITALGKQFGLTKSQIENVTGAANKAGGSFSGLVGYITPAVAGLLAFQKVAGAIGTEFKSGLQAVEDFGMTIAKNTALITTFSAKAKEGDISGAYIEANKYAKELALSLEMIDQKTVANSKHLQAMSETFIANGVLLDINNKKQVEGFTAIANALAILTQGQNQDLQMRQEIRGLMDGEIRSADKLGMLLKAQIPDLEKQLVKWREQGTTIENLGKLLQGFNASTGLLENQWATVGSTMENIHTKILRGMFEPVFEDLIKLAKQLNRELMDSEGNLTPLAKGMVKVVNEAYDLAKSSSSRLGESFGLMSVPIRIASAEINAVKGALENLGSTDIEKAKSQIVELEEELQKMLGFGKEWYEIPLMAPSDEDIAEKKKQIADLRSFIFDVQNEITRESQRAGAAGIVAPAIAPPPTQGISKARDLNAAAQARLELAKAEEEKRLEIIKGFLDQEQLANQSAYALGLSSFSEYLETKNRLSEAALAAQVEAREKELTAARDAAANLSPITDKDGNYEPDKDAKAHADALRKVEDAERAVISARADLTKAVQEGSIEEQKAATETMRGYKEMEIQLLEMTGRDVEAAKMRAELDATSIDRKRLMLDAINGVAGAQEALAAAEKKSALEIERAELDKIQRQKEAQLSIAELSGEHEKSLSIQIELLGIEIKRAEVAGELPEHVDLLKRQRQELEAMRDPVSALVKGWKDLARQQKTSGELMYDLAQDGFGKIHDTFKQTVSLGLKGEFDSIGDAWESLMDTMTARFLNLIAELTVNSLFDALQLGQISGGGPTWGSFLKELTSSGSSGGSSGGSGGTVTGAVGSLAQSYLMKEYITPFLGEITGTISSYMTGVSSYFGAAQAGAYTGAVTGATSVGASEAAAAGAGMAAQQAGAAAAATSTTASTTFSLPSAASLSTAGWMALPAMMFAASTYFGGNRQKEHTWSEQGVSTDSFSGLGMDVSGMFYNIADASDEVKSSLNDLGWGFGELDGMSVDAANGLIVTAQAVRDSHSQMVEGMQYQISYFDEAQGRWRTTGDLFGQLLDEMSAIDPVSADAVAATADYVAAAAGVPTVADELATAFLQMQSGMYDLAGAASAAGMQAAAAAAMAGSYASAAQMSFTTAQRQQRQESGSNPSWSMMENPDDYVLGHANGGIHMGGWRMVGERGPELEYTPPSRIFSNTDTNSILQGLKQNQGGDLGPVTVQIIGKGPGLEALIDQVIVTRGRQGVPATARVYV